MYDIYIYIYTYTRGDPRNRVYLLKIVYLFLLVWTCLLQSTLHLMQYTYQDIFSNCSKQFWTHGFWCLLVLLPFFVSCLPHQQNFSIWGLFSSKETNKSRSGKDRVNREGGAWRSCHFWSKSAEHSAKCGQVRSQITHHEMGKHAVSSKKFTEAKHSLSQQHQLVHWYRWVPRTLT